MKNKILKTGRVLFAFLFFVPIIYYFLDFSGNIPKATGKLLHIQLIPAILSGALITSIFLLIFTLLFGRIYCSTLCPAGVLQDIFIRLSNSFKKKRKHFDFHQPTNIIRYSLLIFAILLFLIGHNQILTLLDPYSNIGRIAANLLYPIVIGINNVAATFLMKSDNYSLYYISLEHITWASLILSIIILLTFFILSFFRGRLFCNTLCPVGSLLGLFSRYSFFKISLDENKCNSCRLCERKCKSECIDSKNKSIDTSRCINCFNCLDVCKKGGVSYKLAFPLKKIKSQDTDSRRSFIVTIAGISASIPFLQSCTKRQRKVSNIEPITPPGAKNKKHFEKTCTACHLCVVKCPSKIMKPAGVQYGFDFFLKPHLNYEKSFCTYECTICSEVCPNHALQPLSVEEKITTQIGIVQFNENLCVVKTEEKDCGACSEHCPTQAVKMVPYKGDLRIPEITPDICVGCGGCECICPVRPIRAITVTANLEHKKISKPEYEKVKEVEVTGFGF